MNTLFSTLTTVLLMLLPMSPSASETHSDYCVGKAGAETLFPDYDLIADWGVRINHVQTAYPGQETEVQKRPVIEYEQDQRITYEEEDVSITKFWQGCESFIGRQTECESDESFSLLITPDQLDDFLIAQGSFIKHDPESNMSFAEPKDEFWGKSDNPIIEKKFNFSMTKDEISALGDFKQLSFRQAIRITVDINQHLDQFYFEDTQLPFTLLTSEEGLYVDSKVILKAMYISSGDQELRYIPLRGLLPENYSRSWCQNNTCGFEFLSKDVLNVEYIHKQFSEWPPKGRVCYGYDVIIGWLSAGVIDYYTEIEKAIFHYEIQTSIINASAIENFNPLDYMDRDLTLPKDKGAGSVFYLLILALLTPFTRRGKQQEAMTKVTNTPAQAFSLRALYILAIAISVSANSVHSNIFTEETTRETLLSDYGIIVNWGLRLNSVEADYSGQEGIVRKRPEIEYEQDRRITFDEETVKIAKFWQGCESFIGRQSECESDESISLIIAPDQLNDFLVSQGSLISSDIKNSEFLDKFKDANFHILENPILEDFFSLSMTEDEIDSLGDFKQLSFRQAIRMTVDVDQYLDGIDFENLQHQFDLLTSDKGLYVDSKVIIKTAYIAKNMQEQAYTPFRSDLLENRHRPWCSGNTCSLEYLINDRYDIESIYKRYSVWLPEYSMCASSFSSMRTLPVGKLEPDTDVDKVIFHYEIQTSIINAGAIENFNPLDYMDRNLTLPKDKGAGSVFYLLILLLAVPFRFHRRKVVNS